MELKTDLRKLLQSEIMSEGEMWPYYNQQIILKVTWQNLSLTTLAETSKTRTLKQVKVLWLLDTCMGMTFKC